ncbi:glycine-rich domain-containing protein [Mucilaginibacter terrae]|uniref:TIGR04222 domain-containing membrane protein n=1 Tax=Mucilaginibacter terrae TaxID=1955052 RepID=A0ABU3GXM7_9SPHI|nr:hypothetical protein [Mucilaginibacter terrae]MDT3404351.1 hypothetical protein [Mucilaginibacter terrae]
MMTEAEQILWKKIAGFKLDDEQSSFTFTARLARENGWSGAYTIRVVEEYKKFIFLCCLSPSGVTPSDAVDQAWHLHLTYTKSYWVDFCRDTLGQEIHHNPTKGGNAEAEKFDGYYTQSFKLYEDKFGTQPPADIWLDNEQRFSDIDFQRVNIRRFKLIKPWMLTALKISAYVLFAVVLIIIVLIIYEFNGQNYFMPALVLFAVIGLATIDHNQTGPHKKQQDSGCGEGGSCSGDSDSGHSGHGDGHGGHGCSSGCSGCSGSGCSGCGGGCGGD